MLTSVVLFAVMASPVAAQFDRCTYSGGVVAYDGETYAEGTTMAGDGWSAFIECAYVAEAGGLQAVQTSSSPGYWFATGADCSGTLVTLETAHTDCGTEVPLDTPVVRLDYGFGAYGPGFDNWYVESSDYGGCDGWDDVDWSSFCSQAYTFEDVDEAISSGTAPSWLMGYTFPGFDEEDPDNGVSPGLWAALIACLATVGFVRRSGGA